MPVSTVHYFHHAFEMLVQEDGEGEGSHFVASGRTDTSPHFFTVSNHEVFTMLTSIGEDALKSVQPHPHARTLETASSRVLASITGAVHVSYERVRV